jgi:hypothetical protein
VSGAYTAVWTVAPFVGVALGFLLREIKRAYNDARKAQDGGK